MPLKLIVRMAIYIQMRILLDTRMGVAIVVLVAGFLTENDIN